MEIAVIIVVVIALIGAFALGARWMEKRRQQDLAATAESLGLEFKPAGDALLQNELSRFELFNTGRSRNLTNLVEGATDEVRIAIFDYAYTTGNGKHQNTVRQTVVWLQSPSLQLPSFSMRPENLFDKIGSVLGFQDIDFDDHPEFSMQFVLQGDNETAIRQFFTTDIIEFFRNKAGFSVEAHMSGSLIFYRPRKREKPDRLKDLLTEAYEVFGCMVDANSA